MSVVKCSSGVGFPESKEELRSKEFCTYEQKTGVVDFDGGLSSGYLNFFFLRLVT